MPHTGKCLCGGIEYEIDVVLPPIQICHCKQCQRSQGTAIATNIPVPRSNVHIKRGKELISEYESSPGKKRCFCSVCGSPVYSYREALPETLRIRVGLIDDTEDLVAEAHFHVASKCSWLNVSDDLPHYSTGQRS